MDEKTTNVLKEKMDDASFQKLQALGNDKLNRFVLDAVELCEPDSVKVCSDDPEDIAFIRQLAIDNQEEIPLEIEGHTAHFDGYFDQARDKSVTKYLLPKGMTLAERLNSMDREEGLTEIRGFFKGAMQGRQMLLMFLCLGPTGGPFSIPCAQITDSAYVGHSEYMLYRAGYEEFRKLGNSPDFFRFFHATGRVDDRKTAVDVENKRVYMDITEDMVLSVNTQYAGNTVGLKKLALRLAIRKADREGWLAEHMFVMGVHGPNDRVTYFTGAFPSACGKTSTAMLPGESIVGDDLAYFRKIDGQVRAVNVESGIFGIIRDVNPDDDPVIYDVLTKPGEVIFGNVLVKDGKPYWMGMGQDLPEEGQNYLGHWHKGDKGPDGKDTTPSHKNARYTVRISALANRDEHWDKPDGVPVGGIIYGGRDSDTSVPVWEAFDWTHGIITIGASIESESTAATMGAEGVRQFNMMSNMDFLAIPLGKYIMNNVNFVDDAEEVPLVFGTNYFLKDADGSFLNGMRDKGVWVKWMELRAHGDVDAIESPIGRIPRYEDLKPLFRQVLDKDYAEEDYLRQFSIRVPEQLAKIDRIEKVYQTVEDTPDVVWEQLKAQRARLEELQAAKGDCVKPSEL
ncbi:MAG: phosphoenolpyruvate carboxykinase (GTP) [Phycisphaerae bacterium]